MQKTIAKLFDVHQNTVTNWKKEKKKGLLLLIKYFSKEELEEFIQTDKITRLENLEQNNFFIQFYLEFISKWIYSLDNLFSLFLILTNIIDNKPYSYETEPVKNKIFFEAVSNVKDKKFLLELANLDNYLCDFIIQLHLQGYSLASKNNTTLNYISTLYQAWRKGYKAQDIQIIVDETYFEYYGIEGSTNNYFGILNPDYLNTIQNKIKEYFLNS
ncbi:hypothetical protein [Sulfurospirillum multivorans]|uniref:Uncharacterized protein n=2 Tax=Sulfurospirillum multivorans TaxID=66821 RepID=A0AA86ALB6_SULMK|nr:hypothetical protein [Sulfurospirillum multivorans]AHJ11692.1 hypothetical protein SMUL_0411 [Sulfurospirillum multivorans DSM 12446]QEH05192.1 hypothetical protein SMN_0404 [Sulfurospirillum multivorans]